VRSPFSWALLAAIALTPAQGFGDSRQDAEQKLVSALTSPDCHVKEIPPEVIHALVASLSDDFLTIHESFGLADVACIWTIFGRLEQDSSDSVEEWAIYFGTPGLGYVAVVRHEGTAAEVIAGTDSLDGFGLGALRSYSASYLGIEGIILDVTGIRGLSWTLATELLLWDGRSLHLLTPVDPTSSPLRRSDLVIASDHREGEYDWEWKDIDGDNCPEIIVRHGIVPDPDNPGRRVLIPQRAYKLDPLLKKFTAFEGEIPDSTAPPGTQ